MFHETLRDPLVRKKKTEFMPSFEDVHSEGSVIFQYNQTSFFRSKLVCTVERNGFLAVVFQ